MPTDKSNPGEMVPPEGTTEPRLRDQLPRATAVNGLAVIILLCVVCFAVAFRRHGDSPVSWLPFLSVAAALAVVVSVRGTTFLSSRFQKILVLLFAAQAVWTVASMLWATSKGNAWEEINRTIFYAMGMALTFAAVRWAGSRGLRVLAGLVTGAIGLMALVIAIRLGLSDTPLRLFEDGRLNYPVKYFNGLASLLMVGAWLSLGLANAAGSATRQRAPGPSFRWTQPLLVALSVFFVELALLAQSRGALWTSLLVVPFFVLLSPHRFRALVNLAIVALPVFLFWSRFNDSYVAIRDGTSLQAALSGTLLAIGYSVLIVLAAWAVTWIVERRLARHGLAPLSRRVTIWVGIALVVVAAAGAAGSLVYADVRTGGLDTYLNRRWSELTGDQSTSGSGTDTRFTEVSLNGRLAKWKVAAEAYADNPVTGLGAQNFEVYYYQHRTNPAEYASHPQSQIMQLLAELGLPGLLLWLAFVILTLAGAVWVRFRMSCRADQAVVAAMMTAVIFWFGHSAIDRLWQTAALSLPALMLLGGLVAADPGGPTPARVATNALGRASWLLRATRLILALLALLVIVSAALPYLSMRYSNLAARAQTLRTVTARANTAATLDPTSVLPFTVRANAHALAGARAPVGSPDRLEQFELAAAAWVEATRREPDGWLYFCEASRAFLAARNAALAADDDSAVDLERSAQRYLEGLRRLNPLSSEIGWLEKFLAQETVSYPYP